MTITLLTRLPAGAQGPEEVIVERKPAVMRWKEGPVNFQGGTNTETSVRTPQPLGFGDSLRTLRYGRAAGDFNDHSPLRMQQLTRLSIVPLDVRSNTPAVRLLEGQIYVLDRRAHPIPIITPQSKQNPKGTEFMISADARETIVTMFDGSVEMDNGTETRRVESGFQGIARAGEKIQVHPILEARNIVQWWIYYPGVLNVDDAEFAADERNALAASLAAYRSGDLRRALETFPGHPDALKLSSDAQRVYYAALILSVGDVQSAESLLQSTADTNRPAQALWIMIDAVAPPLTKEERRRRGGVKDGERGHDLTSSECLALSYAHQATNNLSGALALARAAVQKATNFGFGWARVAELEFSFGRTRTAKAALGQALRHSPRNAQAHALNGFLLAARNRDKEALHEFDEAIALDPALGNAWLGRGLVCIHRGETDEGHADLETAATLEPRRSLVRSYLGKAYTDVGIYSLADQELRYASKLDENDPTPWLYSALSHWEQNRFNEAVRDLERSELLNDNRALFRSTLLLDQDRAVRGANLANIYADAGMNEVGVREAVRAVNADYANYSAHLFLAGSYNELRDPRLVNLRYETPAFTEYLLANLLAPVGAGTLSPAVSQLEYSKLFDRDRLGFVSSTEYQSRGDWIHSSVQYGVLGNFAYALEGTYRNESLDRHNAESEQNTLSVRLKQQVASDTSVYAQIFGSDFRSGDLIPTYDNMPSAPRLRIHERQDPSVLGGLHHEWSPEHHTLFLAGRIEDIQYVRNPDQGLLLLIATNGMINNVIAPQTQWFYRSAVELYPLELQHLWRQGDHHFTLGANYQFGTFETRSRFGKGFDPDFRPPIDTPALAQKIESEFDRFSAYAYDHWQVQDSLGLVAGLSYDRMKFPANHRFAPITADERTKEQLSPKAGFIWDIAQGTTLRGAYTRSLGGVSFDQSVRLEPTQVAGFNQAWRSLIPEAVAGANAAPRFETWGVALDQKFQTGTYVGIEANWLKSDVSRQVGALALDFVRTPRLTSTREELDYDEQSVAVTLNQLVGNSWSFGAQYRFSRANLENRFPTFPSSVRSYAEQDLTAFLHQARVFARCYFENGLFAHAESIFVSQENDGYGPRIGDDSVWQANAWIGYRFPRRRAELRAGILNFTDQNYRLNPLNVMNELPRERTFTLSLKIAL